MACCGLPPLSSLAPRWRRAAGDSSRTARRAPARRGARAAERASQSRSAFRLMTAPHVHVIHTRSPRRRPRDRRSAVLLVEGPERVEECRAALVEHALLDHLVHSHQQRLRDRQAERSRSLQVDHQLELGRLLNREVGRLRAL